MFMSILSVPVHTGHFIYISIWAMCMCKFTVTVYTQQFVQTEILYQIAHIVSIK